MFGTIPRPIWARRLAARMFERDRAVRRLRRHLSARAGAQSVIEAGCGFGFNADQCAGSYTGLDLDPDVVLVARRARRGGTFLVADAVDPEVEPRPRHTALLCLLLHEVEPRGPLLAAMASRARERLLVYDYDPALGALERIKLRLMEPPAIESYWDLDLPGEVAPLGFRLLNTESIGGQFRCWEFVRKGTVPLEREHGRGRRRDRRRRRDR